MKTKFILNLFLILGVLLLLAISSEAQPVTKIAAGTFHSLFLKSDGSLWAMGLNNIGQFGDGTYSNSYRPRRILTNGVIAITAGNSGNNGQSLFLKSDGSLWATGLNNVGQLGDGSYNNTNRAEQIVASNVTTIAASGNHSLLLKNDGSLWAMGDNLYGQLGDGTYTHTNRPKQILVSNVTAIAVGGNHSLLLKVDGSLWGMGDRGYGQLGDGVASNPYTNSPELIVASNVTAIAAGYDFSLFLKNDGSLWAMGNNSNGQLGDGTTLSRNPPKQIVATNVTMIAAGKNFSLFIKSDGSLWGMGYNSDGELGDGTYNFTNRPEQIVASNVTAIASGYDCNLFLKTDGSLWGMGGNFNGALGDGTFNKTNRPEEIVGPPINLTSVSLAGASLVLNGTCGLSGSTNYLLMSTSVVLPIYQWTRVATNILNASGNFTMTNAVNPNAPQSFYLLQSQ